MDQQLPNNPEIQRLIRLSAAARSCLTQDAIALRHRLDFPARVRDSLHAHPSAWWLGSLASGVAASWLFRRKRPTAASSRRGWSASLLSVGWTATRPLAKIWLRNQLTKWLAERVANPPAHGQTTRSSRSHTSF